MNWVATGAAFKTLDDLPKALAELSASGGPAVRDFHLSGKVLSPSIRRAHPQPVKQKA